VCHEKPKNRFPFLQQAPRKNRKKTSFSSSLNSRPQYSAGTQRVGLALTLLGMKSRSSSKLQTMQQQDKPLKTKKTWLAGRRSCGKCEGRSTLSGRRPLRHGAINASVCYVGAKTQSLHVHTSRRLDLPASHAQQWTVPKSDS
jgi:hypothetical protein